MASSVPPNLGRYEILQELGRGAMGVVYLARDPLIGRRVAIKTFHSTLGVDDSELLEFRTRFIREAQSAGILSHPNIVMVHDVVEQNAEGVAFIAMEYVEGTNLKEVLQKARPMGLEEIVRIVEQVAAALDYAHGRGVIHRDIKPANIIIDREGLVKITDFGIARFETSDLTQDGQLLGTPNYMAPERIQGGAVDHRTDVFSLGVVLYELLTRRKPFQGDNFTMVSHRIVYEPFTPLEQLAPDVPRGLVAVISRALAKKPEGRFERAGQLAQELRRAAAASGYDFHAPVPRGPAETHEDKGAATQDLSDLVATMASSGHGGSKVTRSPRAGLWAVSGALLLLLVAATSAALWVRRPEPPPPPRLLAEERKTSQLHSLISASRMELTAGRSDAAAQYLLRAVALEPGAPELADLQSEVARSLQKDQVRLLQRVQIIELLAAAQVEAEAGRHEEAVRLLDEALALEPEAMEALELRDASLQAQERQRRREHADRQRVEPAPVSAEAETPAPVPEPQRVSAPTPEPAEGAEATVAVSFFTELPDGILTLYAGRRQVLRERFSFYERTGFLRNEPRAGRIDARFELEAGESTFRAYVARGGERAQMVEVELRLEAGAESTLRVHLAADGTLRAWIE